MKIFYITASFPFSASESFLLPEIEALKNEGIELCIVPIFPRGKLRKDWDFATIGHKLYSEKLISLKILFQFIYFSCLHPIKLVKLLRSIKLSPFSQFVKNVAILPKSIWLAFIIKKENPTHIHAHWGGTTSTAAMFVSAITKVSWSFTCHRWDIYENNLLARKAKAAAFVRYISNKGREDSVKFGVPLNKSVIIPMGTNIPEILHIPKWDKDGNEFKIICPANLIPVKGHVYLIEAIDILINKGYRIKLLLAGEGALKKDLQSLVRSKNLEENITFLGQVSHNVLLKYYENGIVHLMILPSVDLGNGEHEGVPVSLMEAMSYGIPVISTKTGSIGELIPEHFNVTVEDKNSKALAEKISWLYDSPAAYKECGKLGREIIEKNWDVKISVKNLLSKID